jgi:hypothetical protein
MNRYELPTYRPAFGIAAAAMTALTMAIAVVLPATLAGAGDETTLAATRPPMTAPLRLEIVAPRNTASGDTRQTNAG